VTVRDEGIDHLGECEAAFLLGDCGDGHGECGERTAEYSRKTLVSQRNSGAWA
jgi:hypothetical protein